MKMALGSQNLEEIQNPEGGLIWIALGATQGEF